MKELNRLAPTGVADFYHTDAEDDIPGVAAPDDFDYGYFQHFNRARAGELGILFQNIER